MTFLDSPNTNSFGNEGLNFTKSTLTIAEKKLYQRFKTFRPTSFLDNSKPFESMVSAVPIYEKYIKNLNKSSQERFRDLKQVSLAEI